MKEGQLSNITERITSLTKHTAHKKILVFLLPAGEIRNVISHGTQFHDYGMVLKAQRVHKHTLEMLKGSKIILIGEHNIFSMN